MRKDVQIYDVETNKKENINRFYDIKKKNYILRRQNQTKNTFSTKVQYPKYNSIFFHLPHSYFH
jgi:hypothetical protein